MNRQQLAFLPDDIDYRLGAKVDPKKATAAPVITPAPPFMVEGYLNREDAKQEMAEQIKKFITPAEKPAVSESVTHMDVLNAAVVVKKTHGADLARAIVYLHGGVRKLFDIPDNKLKAVYDELQRHIPKAAP